MRPTHGNALPLFDTDYQDLLSFFEGSPQMMGIVELQDDKIVHSVANPAAARFLGIAPADIPGKTANDFGVIARHRTQWFKLFDQARQTREPARADIEVEHHGRKYWFATTILYLRTSPRGYPVYSYFGADITERKATEAELKLSRERLSFALEGTNDGIWNWNVETGEVIYGARWCELLEYKPEEVPPNVEFWRSSIHPDQREGVLKRLQEHLDGKSAHWEEEHLLRTRSGQWKWILSRGKVIERDAQGRARRMAGASTDISAQKKVELDLQESRSHLARLMDIAPVGIFQTDAEGNFTYANEQWFSLCGCKSADVMGQGWQKVIHPEDRQLVFEQWEKSVREKRLFALSHRYLTPKGKSVWVKSQAIALTNPKGEIIGYLGSVQDVSELKMFQSVLEKSNAALDEALRQAEDATNAKSEFVAQISHELRTPLNGILGLSQLLEHTVLDEEQRDYVTTIRSCGDALLQLINETLDLSAIEARKVDIQNEPFCLRNWLEESIAIVRVPAEQKGLTLDYTLTPALAPKIVSDPGKLRQILINLAGNAIKFTAEGRVDIRVRWEPVAGPQGILHLTVQDTGPGIPEDKRQEIFKTFVRLHSGSRAPGSGLGLAITKRLVEAMGGSIEVESTPGAGSRFNIRIPARAD